MASDDDQELIRLVREASESWQRGFNAGDAARCASLYEETATMRAEPFGTYEGSAAIQRFWQNLISDGYADVEYIEPRINAVDDNSAVLSSEWRMNKARGIIHRELWILQEDGTAKLREDHFEAL